MMYKIKSLIILLAILIVLFGSYSFGDQVEYYLFNNFDYEKIAYIENYIYSVKNTKIIEPEIFGDNNKILISPDINEGLITRLLENKKYALIINPNFLNTDFYDNLHIKKSQSNYVGFKYSENDFFEDFESAHYYFEGKGIENIAYLNDGIKYIPYIQKYQNIIFISNFNIGEDSSKLLEKLLNEYIFDIYKPFEGIMVSELNNYKIIDEINDYGNRGSIILNPFLNSDISLLSENIDKYSGSYCFIELYDYVTSEQLEELGAFTDKLLEYDINYKGIYSQGSTYREKNDIDSIPIFIEKSNDEYSIYEYGRKLPKENVVKVVNYKEYYNWLSDNYVDLLLAKDSRIFMFIDDKINVVEIKKIQEINDLLNIRSYNWDDIDIGDKSLGLIVNESPIQDFVFNASRTLSFIFLIVCIIFAVLVISLRNRRINNLFR